MRKSWRSGEVIFGDLRGTCFWKWAALLTLRSRSAARQAPGRSNHTESAKAAFHKVLSILAWSMSTLLRGLEESRGEAPPNRARPEQGC